MTLRGRVVHTIIPIKSLKSAKRRLAGVLLPDERRDLVQTMLLDTVLAARAARLGPVSVVSPDHSILDLAESAGARPLAEAPRLPSLNHALARALEDVTEGDAALILLGDTPLVTPEEIITLAQAGENAAGSTESAIALAPDRAGKGTNALFLQPSGAIPLRFGSDSLARHLAEAERRGVRSTICYLPGIALDLDAVDDLSAFLETPARTETHALLQMLRVPERLPAQVDRLSVFAPACNTVESG